LLGGLPDSEASAILEVNRTQIQPYEKLYGRSFEEAVKDTRARGYALMPVNVLPYVSGVAVVVPVSVGAPNVALSLSALSNRLMAEERYLAIVELLRREAQVIAEACVSWASRKRH
jgi:DNA-binding IclR family transcriptional regulator